MGGRKEIWNCRELDFLTGTKSPGGGGTEKALFDFWDTAVVTVVPDFDSASMRGGYAKSEAKSRVWFSFSNECSSAWLCIRPILSSSFGETAESSAGFEGVSTEWTRRENIGARGLEVGVEWRWGRGARKHIGAY